MVIPLTFEYAEPFSEGFAAVDMGGKWGYIDKTGKLVIKHQFDRAAEFSEGRARVIVGRTRGYINTSGKYVWGPNKIPRHRH